MTARILLTIKFLLIYCYSFALPPLAKMTMQATGNEPPELIFYLFTAMMFIPETSILFFKGFREWIKEGLENADGKMNHNDVKDLVVHYASLWSLRIFVLSSLLMMFYNVEFGFQYYIVPFFGSIGLSGFTILKNILGKR